MATTNTKNFIFVVSVLLVIFFIAIFVRATWYVPIENITPPNVPLSSDVISEEASVTSTVDQRPVRLIIPVLKIDTNIQHVGLTKDGKMGVPSNYSDVGWYMYGAMPGTVGSAVMAGHVDNGLAFPGVFKYLGNLKAGDDVYVERSDGVQLHYKMTTSQIYDKDADAPEVFIEHEKSLLRLITCTGEIIKSERTHADRLVVTAELVE